MSEPRTAMDDDRLAADDARDRRLQPGVLPALTITAEPTPASRVLEIGCGTGYYQSAIAAFVGCIGIGIDPSSAMLAREPSRDCRSRGCARAAWQAGAEGRFLRTLGP